jgi:hypothetical protein
MTPGCLRMSGARPRAMVLFIFGLLACEGEERPYHLVSPLQERDAGPRPPLSASQSSPGAGETVEPIGPTDVRDGEQSPDPATQLMHQLGLE